MARHRRPAITAPLNMGGLATNARRVEVYMRSSLYLLLGFELVFPLTVLASLGQVRPLWWAFLAGTVAQVALNIAVCRWALTAMRTGRLWRNGRRPWLLLAAWGGVASALLVLVPFTMEPGLVLRQVQVLAVVVSPLCAVVPVLSWRVSAISVVAAAVAMVGLTWLGIGSEVGLGFVLGISVSLSFYAVLMVVSFWLSGWMIRVIWQLDGARDQAAALAIAEERLRIARDLHDVFGRTLATVAVKSELAAELVRRGRNDAAAEEIGAVRAIADDAGREVRQVVNGVRAPTLSTELAGSRSLLGSAGIRCVVDGNVPSALPAPVAEALAWALREATTNVIRHSQATECAVTITDTDPVRLLVSNDGADAPERPGGHGLRGIAERVALFGGGVEHRRDGGRFVVDVCVPLAPASPASPSLPPALPQQARADRPPAPLTRSNPSPGATS